MLRVFGVELENLQNVLKGSENKLRIMSRHEAGAQGCAELFLLDREGEAQLRAGIIDLILKIVDPSKVPDFEAKLSDLKAGPTMFAFIQTPDKEKVKPKRRNQPAKRIPLRG